MKKRVTALSVLLILVITACLSGCSKPEKFDASGYVKSVLDTSFKGEYTEYMKFTESTEEEAKAQYQSVIDNNMEAFSEAGISEELQDKYRQFFTDLYKAGKYEVGEATEVEGGFEVEVSSEPIKIFDGIDEDITKISDDYIAELTQLVQDGGEVPGEDVINEEVYKRIYDVLDQRLQNIQYGDSTSMIVHVELNEDTKLYEIPDSDLTGLEEMIIDLGDLL